MQLWIDLCGFPKSFGVTSNRCPDCPELCFGLDLRSWRKGCYRLCTAHHGFCLSSTNKLSTAQLTKLRRLYSARRHKKRGHGDACHGAAGQAPAFTARVPESYHAGTAHTHTTRGQRQHVPGTTPHAANSQQRAAGNLRHSKKQAPTICAANTCTWYALPWAWRLVCACRALYARLCAGVALVASPPGTKNSFSSFNVQVLSRSWQHTSVTQWPRRSSRRCEGAGSAHGVACNSTIFGESNANGKHTGTGGGWHVPPIIASTIMSAVVPPVPPPPTLI